MDKVVYQLPLDVSRCGNGECDLADSCARYRDLPFFAAWLAFNKFEPGQGKCEHFIKYTLDTSRD